LIGDGVKMPIVKSLVKELGIEERVIFAGKISNIEKIIPNATCVLQPSYTESFGMVSLEAMSCGVPAVTSNKDGIPEVVEHGKTGFIAEADDHEKLAEYLIKICTDDELREKLGKNARERVLKYFLWDDKVNEYLKCYEKLLKSRGEEDGC
jgi:glycosyltransferase involved in cell wall biosynthesis